MRNPRDFFEPLAIDAPQPLREIPVKPSRMIHFFDASNEKMRAKVPDMVEQADILLGNLEDAVPVDKKVPAREGLIEVGKEVDFGETQLWTRVNALESPWVLDDLTQLVTEIGDKLEVIMIPKVEGPWDIHYVDRLLAQLEAKAGLERPPSGRPGWRPRGCRAGCPPWAPARAPSRPSSRSRSRGSGSSARA